MERIKYKSVQEIRRQNLRLILKEQFGGVQNRMAAAYKGAPPSFINRLLKSTTIGDRVARAFEHIARKPQHWLDQEHERVAKDEKTVSPPSYVDWATLRRCRTMKDEPHKIAAAGKPSRLHIPLTAHSYETEVIDASMEPLLGEGEHIIVNLLDGKRPKKGDIVIAFADGDVYVRRYSLDANNNPIIEALNKSWPEPVIKLSEERGDWVAGKVIAKLELIV